MKQSLREGSGKKNTRAYQGSLCAAAFSRNLNLYLSVRGAGGVPWEGASGQNPRLLPSAARCRNPPPRELSADGRTLPCPACRGNQAPMPFKPLAAPHHLLLTPPIPTCQCRASSNPPCPSRRLPPPPRTPRCSPSRSSCCSSAPPGPSPRAAHPASSRTAAALPPTPRPRPRRRRPLAPGTGRPSRAAATPC